MAERGPRFASARAALGNAQPQAGRACVLRDRLSALPWCLSMNTQTSFLEDVSTLDVECVKMVYLIYVLTHFHKNVAPGSSFCYSLCTSVGESIPLVLLSACPAVSPLSCFCMWCSYSGDCCIDGGGETARLVLRTGVAHG